MKTAFHRNRLAGMPGPLRLAFAGLFFQVSMFADLPSSPNAMAFMNSEKFHYDAGPGQASDWSAFDAAWNPDEIVFTAGDYNLRHSADRGFGALQIQFAKNYHGFHPYVQGGRASIGSKYVGSGVLYNFDLPYTLRLTAGSGPGWYQHGGHDVNLGYGLEFDSWVELSGEIFHRRVGVTFSHISNAHLSNHNPGTEALGLSSHLLAW
jgi:Lipid A 3-O-deacylase (PagL)